MHTWVCVPPTHVVVSERTRYGACGGDAYAMQCYKQGTPWGVRCKEMMHAVFALLCKCPPENECRGVRWLCHRNGSRLLEGTKNNVVLR
jgi:hypothetical protein